jgi:hypothetical protein
MTSPRIEPATFRCVAQYPLRIKKRPDYDNRDFKYESASSVHD